MQRHGNKREFGDFSDLFSESVLREMTIPLAEKSDKALEQELKSALERRNSAVKTLAKVLCVFKSRFSDYRFGNLCKRNGISKELGKKYAEVGTELLRGGR